MDPNVREFILCWLFLVLIVMSKYNSQSGQVYEKSSSKLLIFHSVIEFSSHCRVAKWSLWAVSS